jgi:ATP-dependent helicase/nuclease subunit A
MQQQSFLFTTGKPARRNLVIEAGAGTGKTTAIVAEVLKLMLERDDLAPERIVLMTFTEKAAGEIADRIRTALEELAASPGPWPRDSANPLVNFDNAARAAHHAANVDRLRSQTIHSFCQSLLRSFPIEAGLDPQFAIVEGFERSLLYGQLYDAWLDHETRVAPTPEIEREWELVFAHVGYLFIIRELILGLLERRDLLAEDLGFGEFEDVLPRLEDAVLWIRRDTATCKDAAAGRVADYLRTTSSPAESRDLAGWGRIDRATASPLAGMDAWIEYLQPIASSIRQIDFRYCGALKEPMTFLRAGDRGNSVYDRLVSHRAAMALVAMTRRFIDFLDAEKRKLGVVDFDDLLLRTLALLDDESVLARARAQFDFIFVDEFQDTDRTQARIIDKLARDASGAFVPGKTIVVGDPKQSIYGFRRADPETYYRMTESLVAEGAEHRILADQYRSDAPLVDTINRMFARLFPLQPHDPNVFRPSYNPLRAARTKTRREPEARITLLHAAHDEKSDRYFAEAGAIAEWIKTRSDGDLRRFAILFRRLTKLDDYLDTFDRHGIDYVLPPTRMFLDRRAPVDLVAVLRAIAYPFDRGAQISAARTPYFALTDEEIAKGVVGSAGEGPVDAQPPDHVLRVAQDDMEVWCAFNDSIGRFRDAARHRTVAELIDLVVDTTSIERVYDAAADGVRHLRHLEHVRAIAFEYDQRIGGSVRQFVEEIDRRREGEPDEMEPSLIDESQNAVRIMSVHAAKGLEFETVILPDLAFQPSPDGLNLFSVEEPPRLVLSGRAESISSHFLGLSEISGQREEAESRRLFYVAVTRAMTDVVFVCNPEEKRSVGFHRSLLECLDIDKKSLPGYWPGVHETAIGLVAFEQIESSGATANKRRRLRDAALEAELAAAPVVPAEIASPAAAAETLTAGEVAAHRAGSRNRAAGILLHRVLELWDGREDAGALLDRVAAESAAGSEAVLRVRQRLDAIAGSRGLQRIARAETIGREVPLRFVENGAIVERRVDRLLREDDRELVVDYKSGAAEEHRLERDRRQVKAYCEAVSAMTGRPCAGAIWYVDQDDWIVVQAT